MHKFLRSAKQDALSEVEANILLNGCKNLIDNLVVRLPLFAGLRIGEVQHLKLSWIDWEGMTLTLPARQICDCKECLNCREGVWSPKTKAGIRSLVITPELEPYLRKLDDGINRTRRALEWRFQKIRDRSGLTKVCYPHALRATFATRLAEEGISAPSLCYLLGWDTLDSADSYIQSSRKRAFAEFKSLNGDTNALHSSRKV